jgi:hypothetical protein
MASSSPQAQQGSAADRRGEPRQKTFLRGRVLYNNRQSSVDCVIRDYSSDGARLVFSEAVPTPDAFEVEIPHKNEIVAATMQWRRDGEMGVQFHRPRPAHGDQRGSDLELSERVRRLEDEIAELRRTLGALRRAGRE